MVPALQAGTCTDGCRTDAESVYNRINRIVLRQVPTVELKQVIANLKRILWETDLEPLSPLRAWFVRLLRIFYATGRDLLDGQLSLQAMGLVYTTLLSFVPLLAVSFSVLKGYGVHNQIEPLLLQFLAPFGEKGAEMSARIIGFVENIKVGVLGAVGLGLLIYTASSLLQKVDRAFNDIWRIKQSRSLLQRFSKYLSVLTIGPVLVFAAIGITASMASAPVVQMLISKWGLGEVVTAGSALIPYVLVIAAFSFVYMFIPNAKVRLSAAFSGALVAGICWQTAGLVFASFVAGSAKYTAIYSGFAVVLLFMIWVYLSWLILLTGASIAFYYQHPEYLTAKRLDMRLSSRVKERLALLVMSLIGQRFYRNQAAWTMEELATQIGLPLTAVEIVVSAIEQHGVIAKTDDEPARYVPARPLDTFSVKELLDVVRADGEVPPLSADHLPAEPVVDRLLERMDHAEQESLDAGTLKDLALVPPRTLDTNQEPFTPPDATADKRT